MDFDKYFFDDEQGDRYRQGKKSQEREYHEESKEYLSSRSDNCWQDNQKNDSHNSRWTDASENQRQSCNKPRTSTCANINKNVSDSYSYSEKPIVQSSNNSCNSKNSRGGNNTPVCEKNTYYNDNSYSNNEIYNDDMYGEDYIYNEDDSYIEEDIYDTNDDTYCSCDDNGGGDEDLGDCGDENNSCNCEEDTDCDDRNDCEDCDTSEDCDVEDCDCEDFCDDDCCFDDCQNDNRCPCGECNRYQQNKIGSYFHGQGEILPFCSDKRAYFIIKNPNISDVDVSLSKFTFSNFGCNPMRVNISYCATMTGNLTSSSSIVTGNSNNCSGIDSTARIFCGNKKKMSDGTPAQTVCVPAFATMESDLEGSAILSPGFACVVELMGVTQTAQGHGIVSFEWWEAPIMLLD